MSSLGVVSNLCFRLWQGLQEVPTTCASPHAGSATYEVGPGKTYSKIADVPLTTLQPGDWVCIYPGTYREKWVINRPGTADKPIVFSGVADANGNRPVIDGDNAVTPTQLNYWNEIRGLIKIGGGSTPSGPASYIRVQHLKLQNANPNYSFTTDSGGSATYKNTAACVYVESGDHLDFVNNEITGCGNGIFTTKGSTDVLIENNYIHGNGIFNRFTSTIRTQVHFGLPTEPTDSDHCAPVARETISKTGLQV